MVLKGDFMKRLVVILLIIPLLFSCDNKYLDDNKYEFLYYNNAILIGDTTDDLIVSDNFEVINEFQSYDVFRKYVNDNAFKFYDIGEYINEDTFVDNYLIGIKVMLGQYEDDEAYIDDLFIENNCLYLNLIVNYDVTNSINFGEEVIFFVSVNKDVLNDINAYSLIINDNLNNDNELLFIKDSISASRAECILD